MPRCPSCGGPPARGVLCAACAEALPALPGLLPAHVSSRSPGGHGGWLIDPFGIPHALAERVVIGRLPTAHLIIQNDSISREHAELRRLTGGWELRDLGSRNGTFVDGTRVAARIRLAHGARLRLGDVAFIFVDTPGELRVPETAVVETRHTGGAAERFELLHASLELCAIGVGADASEAGGGVLLHRPPGAAQWTELELPRLEHQLMLILCRKQVDDRDLPMQARGVVSAKSLVKLLPFQSRFPNEENVRHVVKRLRNRLEEIGAGDLLETVPGRGYYLAWPIAR